MAVTNVPTSMHALRVHDRQHPEFSYEQAPVPEPGIGDVLLSVDAASFTPDELTWPSTWVDRAGRDRAPVIPGHEVAGTVASIGYGTTGFAIGDAVYGLTDWYRDGAASEYVAVEARNLCERPSSIAATEAASLPLAGLTAWQGLFVHGNLQPTQTVVVTGAGGGVGSIAVQLAHNAGASVIAVAHDWARPVLTDLGAEQIIEPEQAAADPQPADLLFDTVGGDLAARCATSIRRGGIAVSVVDAEPVAPAGGNAVFFVVEPDRGQLAQLAGLVDRGAIRPIVGAVVAMPDGAEKGFAAKRRGGIPGKVVLTSGHR